MTFDTHCPECNHKFEVEVTFGEPAQPFGPPEQCHDGGSDEVSEDKCPECGAPLDPGNLLEELAKHSADAELEREIARDEARREAWL